MKYTPEEFTTYFMSVRDAILRPDREKLKTKEFSEVCLDLVLAARELKLLDVLTTNEEVPRSVELFAGRNVEPYFYALGVVAASPFLPQRDYQAALEQVGELLDHPRFFTLAGATQKGFQVKADAQGLNADSLRTNVYGPFTPSSAGYVLASKYRTLGDVQYGANNTEYGQKHVEQISIFLEKLEKTRDKAPDWNDHAAYFKHIFSGIADNTPLGRKDPSMAKILRLVNDGAPLVSVEDCVKATIQIRSGLTHTHLVPPEAFNKFLDVLDDHESFYEVAFQSTLLENRGMNFMEFGLPSYSSDEDKTNFGKNLQALSQRLQGRLPDPKIILSGFLLGTSPSGALSLKDRAQGNPLWLEHAILDKARDPRALKQPNSSLSLVMNALLSGVGEVEKKAFWDSRPEGRYLPKAYEHDGLSR